MPKKIYEQKWPGQKAVVIPSASNRVKRIVALERSEQRQPIQLIHRFHYTTHQHRRRHISHMTAAIIKEIIEVIVITQIIKIKVILIPCLIKILTKNNL